MDTTGRTTLALALGAAGLLGIGRAVRRRRAIRFTDQVVVIVGGSRGLGLVLARELAAEGARLALVARDSEELERARAELSAQVETMAVSCDIRDRPEVEAAVARIVERYGRIDVLINDAGIIQVGPLDHSTIEDFEAAMATHFWGPLFTIMAARPHLARSRTRRIVNVASIGGLVSVPHLVPYSASKFALVGLSEGLHAELSRERIVVTTVSPGLMRTGSTYNAWIKGRHRREFAWFHLSNAVPGVSIDARRAARKILDACRRGQAHLVITPPAKAAVLLHTLMPETTARVLRIASRLLPSPAERGGEVPRRGWQSTSWMAPSAISVLSDRATAENNELPTGRAV